MTPRTMTVALALAVGLFAVRPADAGRPAGARRVAARAAAARMAGEEGRYQPSAKASHAVAALGAKRIRQLERKLGFSSRTREGSRLTMASELVRNATLSGRLGELEAALVEIADEGHVRAPRVRPKRIAREAGRALAVMGTYDPTLQTHRDVRELLARLGSAKLRGLAQRIGVGTDIDVTMTPELVASELLGEASKRAQLPALVDAVGEIERTGRISLPHPAIALRRAAVEMAALPHFDRTRPADRQARDALAQVGPFRLRQVVRRLGLSGSIHVHHSSRQVATEIMERATPAQVAHELNDLAAGGRTSGPGLRAAFGRAHRAMESMTTFDPTRADHMNAVSALAEVGQPHLILLATDLQFAGHIALERAPERVAFEVVREASRRGRLDELKAAVATLGR